MFVVKNCLRSQVIVAPFVVVQMMKAKQHLLQISLCQILRKRAELLNQIAKVAVSILVGNYITLTLYRKLSISW